MGFCFYPDFAFKRVVRFGLGPGDERRIILRPLPELEFDRLLVPGDGDADPGRQDFGGTEEEGVVRCEEELNGVVAVAKSLPTVDFTGARFEGRLGDVDD
jgi:hypothetical protein